MISKKRAREIASSWYGGQWTGLYLIVCNDDMSKISTDNLKRAKKEIYAEWEISRVAHPRDSRTILSLETWIDYKIKERE